MENPVKKFFVCLMLLAFVFSVSLGAVGCSKTEVKVDKDKTPEKDKTK